MFSKKALDLASIPRNENLIHVFDLEKNHNFITVVGVGESS